MHIVSDQSLQRPGYVYNEHGVGYRENTLPWIQWKHIDGPLLYYSDGQLHWLTLWERLRFWIGRDNAESIQTRRRPDLEKGIRNARVKARYDELMREGKHGHYETMFRVVREEVERDRLSR